MRQKKWAAFEEFVRTHGDSLVRLPYVLCGGRGKADDATQEALTRLSLRWGRIDEPLPYARRSVINATNGQWRRSGRRENRERHAAELPPTHLRCLMTWSSSGTAWSRPCAGSQKGSGP